MLILLVGLILTILLSIGLSVYSIYNNSSSSSPSTTPATPESWHVLPVTPTPIMPEAPHCLPGSNLLHAINGCNEVKLPQLCNHSYSNRIGDTYSLCELNESSSCEEKGACTGINNYCMSIEAQKGCSSIKGSDWEDGLKCALSYQRNTDKDESLSNCVAKDTNGEHWSGNLKHYSYCEPSTTSECKKLCMFASFNEEVSLCEKMPSGNLCTGKPLVECKNRGNRVQSGCEYYHANGHQCTPGPPGLFGGRCSEGEPCDNLFYNAEFGLDCVRSYERNKDGSIHKCVAKGPTGKHWSESLQGGYSSCGSSRDSCIP